MAFIEDRVDGRGDGEASGSSVNCIDDFDIERLVETPSTLAEAGGVSSTIVVPVVFFFL